MLVVPSRNSPIGRFKNLDQEDKSFLNFYGRWQIDFFRQIRRERIAELAYDWPDIIRVPADKEITWS